MYNGLSIELSGDESDSCLDDDGLNDQVSTYEVTAGYWELFEDCNYQGRSIVVGPGSGDLLELGNDILSSVRPYVDKCE